MSFNAQAGALTQPGSPGNQTISLAANFDPKLIILWASALAAAGVAAHAQHGIGFGTYRGAAVQMGGVATDARDAALSGDTCGESYDNALLVLHTAASPGSRDLEIDLVSMSVGATSNVIINWVNLHGTASIKVNYLILGGSDISDALVFTNAATTASVATQDITVVAGFGKPDLLFLAHAGSAHNTIATSGEQCLGVAKQGEAGRCLYYGSRDGNTTMFVTMSQRSNMIYRNFSASAGDGTAQGDAHVDTVVANWPTDGFRLVWDVQDTVGAIGLVGLAIRGTLTATSGAGAAPTSGGLPVVQDLNHGSVPSAAFLFGWNLVAATAVDVSSAALGAFFIGAGDGSAEVVSGLTDDDALGTSDANTFWTDQKVLRNYDQAAALQSEADGSISGNNFRLSWNDIDSVAREYQWLTLGAAAGGSTTPQAVADTVVLTEARQAQARKALVDALGLTEGRTAQARKTILETVALTEGLIRFVTHPLAETLSLSENLGAVKLTLRGVADTVALSEQLRLAIAKNAGLIDTLSLVEQLARQTGKSMADTVSLTENLSILKLILRPLADTLLLSENLSLLVRKSQSIAETVLLAEDQALQANKRFAETIGLSENLATLKAVLASRADALSLNETLTRLVRRTTAETVSLTEADQLTVRKILAETAAFTEQLVAGVLKLKSLSDTVLLTETQRRQIGHAVQDTLGLTETRLVAIASRFQETVVLAEVLQAVLVPAGVLQLVQLTGEVSTIPTAQAESFAIAGAIAETFVMIG